VRYGDRDGGQKMLEAEPSRNPRSSTRTVELRDWICVKELLR
jgi:hypothetical protein